MALAAALKEREGLADQAAHTREQTAYLQRQIDRNRIERERLKAEGEQAAGEEGTLTEQLAAQKEALLALAARQTQQAQRQDVYKRQLRRCAGSGRRCPRCSRPGPRRSRRGCRRATAAALSLIHI